MVPYHQKLLAELLGTFALVLTAVGVAAAGEGLLAQALANGLVISVLVAAYAGVSGAHFNPAVTLAFTVVGRLPWRHAGPYLLAQLVAATLAAAALAVLYAPTGDATGEPPSRPTAAVLRPGAALPAAASTPVTSVLLGESIMTALLMIAIYGTMIDPRGRCCYGGSGDSQAEAKIGGMGVGFAVAANILALGPVTGGSMNPARSFGPALVRGDFGLHWCYWVGPILGAIAGATLYETLMREPRHDQPPAGPSC